MLSPAMREELFASCTDKSVVQHRNTDHILFLSYACLKNRSKAFKHLLREQKVKKKRDAALKAHDYECPCACELKILGQKLDEELPTVAA